MAEYHVGCGAFTIYAGTLNSRNKSLWQNKTECTDEAVEIVERWAKEHPKKTRQINFLETFPRAAKDSEGVITLCPHEVDQEVGCLLRWGESCAKKCPECRKKYWFEEVD